MTLRLEGLIEHWPSESLLFVRALPGFQASGRTPAELQANAGAALQAHLDWLVRHELIDEPAGEVDLSVVEQLPAPGRGAGPRFIADLPAPADAEIEAALAVGRAALSDLIDAADVADAGLAGRVLGHVAERDRWYASRIGGRPAAAGSSDWVDLLVEAAGAFEDAVDAFVAARGPELAVRDGEEWTLAKLLRRRTGHLTEHLAELLPRASERS